MSRQAANELTDKGKLRPLEAHFLTLWRADFTIHRANYIVNASKLPFGRLRLMAGNGDGCTYCMEKKGKMLDPFSVSPFPASRCPSETCGVHYLVDVDYVAQRKSRL